MLKATREVDHLIDKEIFGFEKREDCPFYSSKTEDAWLIVEKLEYHFSFGCYRVMPYSSVAWGWNVCFKGSVYPPERNKDKFVRNETFALAVCEAALLTRSNYCRVI